MVVREAGLMFRGFTLVKKTFHKTDKGKIDIDLRSGLLDAILSFAESAFMESSIEYFQGKKFTIVFTKDKIMSNDGFEPEVLTSYVILDRSKKIEKYIHKIVQPLLKHAIDEFSSLNMGKNLSEVSQFREFKTKLDEIYGNDSKTLDQKLKGVFS
ncbi:MAG: hypothetical protein KGD58_10230 [Candidatus Lokiarchaeota archaeon]|nr:hypothetical protein [Candidatus Lokiarchaeota archaeon]